jgi:nicotinic acid mononucleotide adenylyltransferase
MNVSEKNNIGDISNFNNVVYDGINIEKLYIIGSDFINSFVKWDNKNKFYAVLKKIRNDEEEKKMMKVKEKEEKEKEKEKEKEREKYYSNSPFKNLSLSNRSKKKTKKNISNIISDIRNINDNIKLQKNCNTVNTPKPKNNNNALFGKYNII